MPNSETGSSVSDIDVPNRLKSKGMLSNEKGSWLIKKNTEEVEYPSLDGGHSLIKETKVTVGFLVALCIFPCTCFDRFRPLQVTSPDGKHKFTYYENVEGEDDEDEDVSNDGSWEANLRAQCRFCGNCFVF